MNKHLLKVLCPAIGIALVASACSSSGSSSGSESTGAAGASAGSTGGSGGKMTNVTLMVGGLEKVFYLPAELTARLGYFEEEGLKVKLENIPSGSGQVVDTLLTGQSDFNVSFYEHAVDVAAKGKQVESVAVLADVPGEVMLVGKKHADKITSAKDLKGAKVGVTSVGGGGDTLSHYIAQHTGGLKASDITVLGVGSGAPAIAAMQQDRVDVEVQGDPVATQLVSSGDAKVLYDLRTQEGCQAALGGLYPGAALYASNEFVKEHPETTQKMVNAFVKTLKWMHSHSPEEIAAELPADYAGGDMDMYVQVLKNSKPMFSDTGLMPSEGPQVVKDVLSVGNEAVRNSDMDLTKTYTNEFVQKVPGNS